MKTRTASDKQLIINAIAYSKSKNRVIKPRLTAFVDNDTDYISAFNARADAFNARAKIGNWAETVYFDEQIDWDIKAFRGIKEIGEC